MNKKTQVRIKIDRTYYDVPATELTGLQLRSIPAIPIPQNHMLWMIEPGHDDRLVADDESIKMLDHYRFFSTASFINGGA